LVLRGMLESTSHIRYLWAMMEGHASDRSESYYASAIRNLDQRLNAVERDTDAQQDAGMVDL
jgi:hypothetical protein